MKTIYLVSDGDYSDYRVEAVFSDRQTAERFKELHGLTNGIEEFELDKFEPQTKASLVCYFVRLNKDIKETYGIEKWWSSDGGVRQSVDGHYFTHVFAVDEQHAAKVAKDKIMRHIAKEEGL